MILQLVDAADLHRSLDYSVDFGVNVDDGGKWEDKLMWAMHRGLIDEIVEDGQNEPICISPGFCEAEGLGKWVMGNGHHRMAIAMARMGQVYVLFDEEGDWGHYDVTDPT